MPPFLFQISEAMVFHKPPEKGPVGSLLGGQLWIQRMGRLAKAVESCTHVEASVRHPPLSGRVALLISDTGSISRLLRAGEGNDREIHGASPAVA